MGIMRITADGVVCWWERPERPMTEREKRMAELRAKAEAAAPIVRSPLEQRYSGIVDPEDNPTCRPRHQRFDNKL
jgi:hypothetical protein